MLIGSAVFPIAACLMWSRCTAAGAISGALIGQWSGLTFWLVWTKVSAANPLPPQFSLNRVSCHPFCFAQHAWTYQTMALP